MNTDPTLIEDRGDGFPLWRDASGENFYVGSRGVRMRFSPSSPPRFAVVCRLCAMSGISPVRGFTSELSDDGARITIKAPDGVEDTIGVNEATRFRALCKEMRDRLC